MNDKHLTFFAWAGYGLSKLLAGFGWVWTHLSELALVFAILASVASVCVSLQTLWKNRKK